MNSQSLKSASVDKSGARRYLGELNHNPSLGSTKSWCELMKNKYEVIPGKSFGTLPNTLHGLYLSAKCYEHFCKPHPMAGKGVFDCEPL